MYFELQSLILLFFFNFLKLIFFIFKLYIIVLVLPNILLDSLTVSACFSLLGTNEDDGYNDT